MAMHKDFPPSPHEILKPDVRWFPADETLRDTSYEKLMPPLVPELRKSFEWRNNGYPDVNDTSRTLLNWWFKTHPTLIQTVRSVILNITLRNVSLLRRSFIFMNL